MGKNLTNVNLSFWELNQYFAQYDLIVVGSGIVGLFAALNFKRRNKKANVLVLERGVLPHGASTKNAGFACFGSLSELLDDLSTIKEADVWQTVKMRWDGLALLRNTLGDKAMDLKPWGGYEVFDTNSEYEKCMASMPMMNQKMKATIAVPQCYANANSKIKHFGLNQVKGLIVNKHEAQIDTGKMMDALMDLVRSQNIRILNGVKVEQLVDTKNKVHLHTNMGDFTATKVIVATNGFAAELLNITDVKPARAQVLITKPIPNLKIKGTFHYQQGYYYFRNINGRLLFGGARNLDVIGETTTKFETTTVIQKQLEKLLTNVILPETAFEIEHRWVGIMGVGSEKKPIIRSVSPNVIAAVRMGGMGVAIGSLVGKTAAEMAGR